jgi:hypothetical protein
VTREGWKLPLVNISNLDFSTIDYYLYYSFEIIGFCAGDRRAGKEPTGCTVSFRRVEFDL